MPVYTLTITTEFAASHIIPGHPGKCARLHGHNWKVEVDVNAHQLDHLGMGIDFQDIKSAAKQLMEGLDHYHLNDLDAFNTLSPTAENIAAWLFACLSEALNRPHIYVSAVTLWETDRCRVRYSEANHD